MTTEESCSELMLTDVVGIDFVKASAWSLAIPPSIPYISEMVSVEPYGSNDILLKVDYAGNGDAAMQQSPTHKVSTTREPAGIIHQHGLQIPIERGFQTIRDAEAKMHRTEYRVVLHTYDGHCFLGYPLPNTCKFSIEEQMGAYGTMTIKADFTSMSGMIRLNFKETD